MCGNFTFQPKLLSSRRSPNVYKVTNSHGKVVSLCLFKTNYRLGEGIKVN